MNTGGGRIPGIGEPPNGEPPIGDGAGGAAPIGGAPGSEPNSGDIPSADGSGVGDGADGVDANSGDTDPAEGDSPSIAPVAPPIGGAWPDDADGVSGRAVAIGGMAIGLGGAEPGAVGVGIHRGVAGADIGDGRDDSGKGAALAGAENICVNSPGALFAGAVGGVTLGGVASNRAIGAVVGGNAALANIWVNAPGGAGATGGVTGGATGGATDGATDGVTGGVTGSVIGGGVAAPNIWVKAPAGADATGGGTSGGGVMGRTTGAGIADNQGALASPVVTTDGETVFASARPPVVATPPSAAAAPDSSVPPLTARRLSSHARSELIPVTNSVTIANPEGMVAVSSTRLRSAPVSRPSCVRSSSTSSGPAESARCTSTTRPVASSWALWVRMPPSTATHLSSRYLALNSSLMALQRRSRQPKPAGTARQS